MCGNHATYLTYLHRLAKDFAVAFRFPLSCLRRGGRLWGRRVVVRTDCQATPKDGVRFITDPLLTATAGGAIMPSRKSHIETLIQSGRGVGPMKPQQPPKRREGANSGRVCTLEDESSA